MPNALRIVEEIVDLPVAERDAALDRLCAGDPDLRRDVEELLALDEQSAGFLEPPVDGAGWRAVVHGAAEAPKVIGPYHVLRQVGEGGFGYVYEARQDEPIERRVALKIVKPGMDSEGVLRRFAAERRTLSQLEHANIARVLDAGLVPDGQPGAGRPFFAMEFVDGLPITAFAAREGLGIPARLGLVMQVCAAAQHAHTKGIIHRDLKPANILVTMSDGAPVCKVIDYGVAKALVDDDSLDGGITAITNPGAMIGTPLYMSPEQADGSVRVDTRSDVYAIGVVLYELLCGRTPFDELLSGARDPGRIRSAIESADPPTPSTRLSRESRAEQGDRGWTPSHDSSVLRGELDWITMKAIARDPERRYASASALADDLRRYLQNEPVEAGPESRAYRISKYVRRNRVGVVAGSIATAGILSGSVFSIWFGVQAYASREAEQKQREEAEQSAAIAEAVNDFLLDDLLGAVDPTRTADRDITVREALDNAARTVGERFADQPLVEAAIRNTLARTYERIGYPAEAEPHRRRELEIYASVKGEDDVRTITARTSLATTMLMLSRFDEAIDLLTRNMDLIDGRPEFEKDLFTIRNNLSGAYLELGRFKDAAPILAETLEAKRRDLGDRDPSTLTSAFNLAGLYFSLGEMSEAERLYREAWEGRASVLGEADPKTLSSATMLGRVLGERGEYDEAASIIEGALAIAEERLDPGHQEHVRLISAYAGLLRRQGEFAAAEPYCEEEVRLCETFRGADHTTTLQAMGILAEVRFSLGRFEDALTLIDETRAREARVLPPDHWSLGLSSLLAGQCHDKLGDADMAESLLVQALCQLLPPLGPGHRHTLRATDALIGFYEAHGRPDDAARLIERRGTDEMKAFDCSSVTPGE
ncbi:MAG: serine/threonine protein kinase [Phycisphaerales bacterium]|nr:serine/threonine protein kinase [Phycisphaerales bacterium]